MSSSWTEVAKTGRKSSGHKKYAPSLISEDLTTYRSSLVQTSLKRGKLLSRNNIKSRSHYQTWRRQYDEIICILYDELINELYLSKINLNYKITLSEFSNFLYGNSSGDLNYEL